MKRLQNNGQSLFATLSAASLMTGLILLSQSLLIGRQSIPALETRKSHARELSAAFREVAQSALPAIVAIETMGKAGTPRIGQPGGEENGAAPSPFNDIFKDNPEMRELFKRRGSPNAPSPKSTPKVHGMGSGFIINSAGIIVTNNHVVAGAERVIVHLRDGSEYPALEWKTDSRSDVAIVRIKPAAPLPVLKLGDSDTAQVGDWVLAVGSPFGLDFSVTAGIISAKGRSQNILEREDFLQTDAAINPGNSGGPLLNLDGEVVGVNTAITTRTGGYDGVGFAIPSNMVRWVTQQLIDHGEVRRVFLGLLIQPLSTDLARQYQVRPGQGAVIGSVTPSSPAATAKLEAGDIVITLNHVEVGDPRNLQSNVEQLEAGKTYPVEILRKGKRLTIQVTIQPIPDYLPKSHQKFGKATFWYL